MTQASSPAKAKHQIYYVHALKYVKLTRRRSWMADLLCIRKVRVDDAACVGRARGRENSGNR